MTILYQGYEAAERVEPDGASERTRRIAEEVAAVVSTSEGIRDVFSDYAEKCCTHQPLSDYEQALVIQAAARLQK